MDSAGLASEHTPAVGRFSLWPLSFFALAAVGVLEAFWNLGRPGLVLKAAPIVLLAVESGLLVAMGDKSRLRMFIFFGLVFSACADVAIEFQFIYGLVLFLVAHVLYLIAMGWQSARLGRMLPAFAPAILIWLVLNALMLPRAPAELRIPVLIYSTIITSMLAVATSRAFITKRHYWSKMMFVGALFFVISDSIIGLSRWVLDIPHAGVLIMATYYTGQWFISRGAAPGYAGQEPREA